MTKKKEKVKAEEAQEDKVQTGTIRTEQHTYRKVFISHALILQALYTGGEVSAFVVEEGVPDDAIIVAMSTDGTLAVLTIASRQWDERDNYTRLDILMKAK